MTWSLPRRAGPGACGRGAAVRCGDAASGLQRIRHGRAGDRTLLLRQTLSASRGQARRHALRLGLPEQFRRAARTSGDRAAAGQRNRIQRRHRPSDRQPDVDLPGGLRASGLPAEEERRRPRFQPALRPRPGLGGAARPGEGRGAVPRQRQRRLHPDEGRQGPRRGRIRPVARSRARAFPQGYRRPRGVPQRGTGEPAAVEARVEQPVARAQRGNHHPGPAAPAGASGGEVQQQPGRLRLPAGDATEPAEDRGRPTGRRQPHRRPAQAS